MRVVGFGVDSNSVSSSTKYTIACRGGGWSSGCGHLTVFTLNLTEAAPQPGAVLIEEEESCAKTKVPKRSTTAKAFTFPPMARKILEPYRNCAGAERPAEHECLPPGQLR